MSIGNIIVFVQQIGHLLYDSVKKSWYWLFDKHVDQSR